MQGEKRLRIQKPADLGSEAARIIVELNIERSFIKQVCRQLRGERPAQITLAAILRGARFKYPYQGLLIPTERPNKKRNNLNCGAEDSLGRLIERCKLKNRYGTGIASIPFMVEMARRAVPEAKGGSAPKYIL